MKKHGGLWIWALASAVSVSLLHAAVPLVDGPPGVVARVGDSEITEEELAAKVKDHLAAMGMTADEVDGQRELASTLLGELIEEQLLERAASDLPLTDEEIVEAVAARRSRYATEEAFENALRAEGISPDDVSAAVAQELRRERRMAELAGDALNPTDSEIRAAYESSGDRFVEPAAVRAGQIIFRVRRKDSDEVKSRQEARAKEFSKAAGKSKDVSALASEWAAGAPGEVVSIEATNWAHQGAMIPALEQAAFALAPSEISSPIQTHSGWHVLWVEDRRPAGKLPLEQVRSRIRQDLRSAAVMKAMQAMIEDQRDKAEIQILPAFLPRD